MKTQNVSLENVIETKLTKSEFIDLLLAKSIENLNDEYDKLNQEINELRNSFEPQKMIVRINCSASYYECRDGIEQFGSVHASASQETISKEISKYNKEVVKKIQILSKKIYHIQKQRHLLESKNAKTFILKKMLEETEDGRTALEMIKKLSLRSNTNLLSEKN